MMNKKMIKKNHKIKKSIATICLSAFIFSFVSVPTVRAEFWGTNFGAAIMQNAWTEMYEMIKSQAVAYLKKEAAKQISKQIKKIITGEDSGEAFAISDYGDFIYGVAKKEAEKQMDDFFAEINSGLSEGTREIMRSAEEAVMKELNPEVPKVTLDEHIYADDPLAALFVQGADEDGNSVGGGWTAYHELSQGKVNHPLRVYLEAKRQAAAKIAEIEETQKTKATAGQGFDTIKGLPGSVVSQVTAAAEKLPLDFIANATSIKEVLANLATTAIGELFNQGMEYASSQVDAQISKIEDSLGGGAVGDFASDAFGQGARGGASAVQDAIYDGFNSSLDDLGESMK